MRGDDERTLGGGLGAAIFVMPLIFGWLVLRRGYHPGVRIAVGLYMVLSTIPLYMLAATLWTSGDQIQDLARNYDKNRAIAERNAGTARSYMDQYEKGELRETGDGDEPFAPAGTTVKTGSKQLAAMVEHDKGFVAKLTGRKIEVRGSTIGPAQGARAYLEGTDLYPAVILEYAGTPPAEGEVTAICDTVRLDSAGPVLGGCK